MKQPRVPEYREADGVKAYIKPLILFLKDFTMAAWTANNQRKKEIENVFSNMPSIKYPVTSVNGKSGDVLLDAADVGALTSDSKENGEDPELDAVPINADQLGGMTYKMIVDTIYPIGRTIITFSDVDDPNVQYPWQKWERTAQGRMIIGTGEPAKNDDGTSPGNYNHVTGNAGGEAEHTLTTSEMPSHGHMVHSAVMNGGNVNYARVSAGGNTDSGPTTYRTGDTSRTGGGAAHNNMPPYLAANMWRRIE